jgi:hypothetical protein
MFELTYGGQLVIISERRRKFICLHPTGHWRSRQFNDDYPFELSGIIHPEEFRHSIDNINIACQTIFGEKIILFMVGLSVVCEVI